MFLQEHTNVHLTVSQSIESAMGVFVLVLVSVRLNHISISESHEYLHLLLVILLRYFLN